MKASSDLASLLDRSQGQSERLQRFKRNSTKTFQSSGIVHTDKQKINDSFAITYKDSFKLDLKNVKKSAEPSFISQKKSQHSKDTSNYYTFWKNKAMQYQTENHSLHEMNSKLLQDNQILQQKIKKLQKRLEQQSEREKIKTYFPQIQQIYRSQIEKYQRELDSQKMEIQKKDKKIRELSQYLSQNERLKSLLKNFEEQIHLKEDAQYQKLRKNKQNPTTLNLYNPESS